MDPCNLLWLKERVLRLVRVSQSAGIVLAILLCSNSKRSDKVRRVGPSWLVSPIAFTLQMESILGQLTKKRRTSYRIWQAPVEGVVAQVQVN
jgi:hypothetical protein